MRLEDEVLSSCEQHFVGVVKEKRVVISSTVSVHSVQMNHVGRGQTVSVFFAFSHSLCGSVIL